MKTDKEKLEELLTEFGVGFNQEPSKHRFVISCEAGNNKIGGYCGFYTDFEFDLNGKFVSMGAYE